MTQLASTILLVDDSPIALEVARDALEAHGYLVETTDAPLECEALLERHHPDALILDIEMPQLDGISLLELIRRNQHHPCVVLLFSDRPRAELSAFVRTSGADGGAIKTPDCGELIAVLDSVLRARQTSGRS
ncbi:response regulator [Nannocystaceae bacterium ST9]